MLIVRITQKRNDGVGGYVEHHEFADLQAACRREIGEETGLGDDDIEGLTLRYVLLRQRQDELRQQFIYFGTAVIREVCMTEEGVLKWVPFQEVLSQAMTVSNRLTLAHYFTEGPQATVMVGVVSGESSPRIRWAPVSDWEA